VIVDSRLKTRPGDSPRRVWSSALSRQSPIDMLRALLILSIFDLLIRCRLVIVDSRLKTRPGDSPRRLWSSALSQQSPIDNQQRFNNQRSFSQQST
jgi:hypothetical protein